MSLPNEKLTPAQLRKQWEANRLIHKQTNTVHLLKRTKSCDYQLVAMAAGYALLLTALGVIIIFMMLKVLGDSMWLRLLLMTIGAFLVKALPLFISTRWLRYQLLDQARVIEIWIFPLLLLLLAFLYIGHNRYHAFYNINQLFNSDVSVIQQLSFTLVSLKKVFFTSSIYIPIMAVGLASIIRLDVYKLQRIYNSSYKGDSYE